jgi:tetratricopeptide (TPR) repeat protein
MHIPHLAVASSQEEWATQGNLHFEKEQYTEAIECFEKAAMLDKVAVAKAYHSREEARIMVAGSVPRSQAFARTARAFTECASSISKGEIVYFRTAAECYDQAGEHRRAARTYLAARAYDLAAQRHCDGKEYDEAVGIIEKHREMMDRVVTESVIHAARMFYFQNDQWE